MNSRGEATDWLYLASASPRRRRLLDEAGFAHIAEPPPLDDATLDPGDARPDHWVAALAYLKARASERRLARQGRGPFVVLGADTVVVKAGEIIGQPRDRADAERILRALSDGEHDVLTGVAILPPEQGDPLGPRRDIFVDSARVRVGSLTDDMISSYLNRGGWSGKAGAYNLAERLADGWPISYTGDPGAIMGLPMRRLAPRLETLRPAAESAR